jgi:hypothetical protein
VAAGVVAVAIGRVLAHDLAVGGGEEQLLGYWIKSSQACAVVYLNQDPQLPPPTRQSLDRGSPSVTPTRPAGGLFDLRVAVGLAEQLGEGNLAQLINAFGRKAPCIIPFSLGSR